MRPFLYALWLAAATFGAEAGAAARDWSVSPSASKLAFVYTIDGERRRGAFAMFQGAARFDPDDIGAAELAFEIMTGSIDTGDRFGTDALLALLPSHWTVADFGCGTGQLAAELAPCVRQVVGIDNSKAMLKAARSHTKAFGNITLKQADLADVPLADKGCDAVLCVLVLTYLDQPGPVIQEMARVLKPGGKAVVIDLMLHDREDFRRSLGQRSMGFTPESLSELLHVNGLTDARCHPLPPAPDAKGPALLIGTASTPT